MPRTQFQYIDDVGDCVLGIPKSNKELTSRVLRINGDLYGFSTSNVLQIHGGPQREGKLVKWIAVSCVFLFDIQ